MRRIVMIVIIVLFYISCSRAEDIGGETVSSVPEDTVSKEEERTVDVPDLLDQSVFHKAEIGTDNSAVFEDTSENIQKINSFSEEREFQNILWIDQWSLPFEHTVIRFREKYFLGYPMGDGPFCSGSYVVDNNSIIINYPDDIYYEILSDYQKNVLEWMFEHQQKVTYTYDPNYMGFDGMYCLWSQTKDKKLVNHFFKSPVGREYILEGIPVIKYDFKKNRVVILDDLNMRESPSVESPKVIERLFLYNPINSGAEIIGSIVHKNSINSFDAVTVKKDTIDGITAPWYRIQTFQMEEGIPKSVWVFGGYVKEISQSDLENSNIMSKYYIDYIYSLIDRKIIVED